MQGGTIADWKVKNGVTPINAALAWVCSFELCNRRS